MHADSEYIQTMVYTHVYQELLAPKVRKRTIKFVSLYLHILWCYHQKCDMV
jgi:hypothetical protein